MKGNIFAVALLVFSICSVWVRPTFDVHKSGIVVITGASTGIGYSAALKMASLGYTVLAGVRQESDGEAFDKVANVRPILLDVTVSESIDDAVKAAMELELPVVGVMCNAGIGGGEMLPTEYRSEADHQAVFNVNYFGVLATVARFLPILRQTKGRLVVTGSMAGLVAAPMNQPYSASKFAVKSLADSLRRELKPAGVSVSRIDPGFVQTPILRKSRPEPREEAAFHCLSSAAQAPYAAIYASTMAPFKVMADKASTTAVTDRDIAHALTAARPQAVYHPGTINGHPARVVAFLLNLMGTIGLSWQDFVLEQF